MIIDPGSVFYQPRRRRVELVETGVIHSAHHMSSFQDLDTGLRQV